MTVRWLELVVCPRSKSRLVRDGEVLVCTERTCRLQFPILEEIPILRVDEATELPEADWEVALRRAAAAAAP